MTNFHDRFAADTIIGSMQSIRDPLAAEDFARAGWDFACIDLQHGNFEISDMLPVLLALEAGRCPALVRTRSQNPDEVMRSLDYGVAGVIVPMIDTPEQARRVASAARYAPQGTRSFGPLRHSAQLDATTPLVIVMVETLSGLANVSAIAETDGIDAVMLGPADLTLSAGHPLSMTPDPFVIDAASTITSACKAAGKVSAGFSFSVEAAAQFRNCGMTVICHGSDRAFLGQAMARQVALVT